MKQKSRTQRLFILTQLGFTRESHAHPQPTQLP